MIPAELVAEADALRQDPFNHEVDLVDAGPRVYVIFRNYSLPAGYTPAKTDLMMFTSTLYPNTGFDMFWTGVEVTLADGRAPQSAEAIEEYEGRKWRRFSWHLNRPWNPTHDSLRSWFTYCQHRLRQKV